MNFSESREIEILNNMLLIMADDILKLHQDAHPELEPEDIPPHLLVDAYRDYVGSPSIFMQVLVKKGELTKEKANELHNTMRRIIRNEKELSSKLVVDYQGELRREE